MVGPAGDRISMGDRRLPRDRSPREKVLVGLLVSAVFPGAFLVSAALALSPAARHDERTRSPGDLPTRLADLPTWLKGFSLPIVDARLPATANLYPGASRSYRGGIHKGVDFYVEFGTPVVASKEGYVVRVESAYQEMSPAFRRRLLRVARQLDDTPSDILDALYGRQMLLDHGIVDGHRVVTRYAHLSKIEPELEKGAFVEREQVIGSVGNSGTSNGTMGTSGDSHLHFEMYVDDVYVGAEMSSEAVQEFYRRIFNEADSESDEDADSVEVTYMEHFHETDF
jgi:murein DD-endopeptidase MepM/ murein hydrolase activator NlpD